MTVATTILLIFASPMLAVAGLAAMAVPLAIHLLWRRRRRPFEWGAMELLAQAIRRRRRQLQLEQLLLLAVRMALIAALGCAVAQPFLGGGAGGGPERIWIVLDDGVASRCESEAGGASEFERLQQEAASLIDGMDSGSVGVVLASRPPRVLAAMSSDRAGVRGRLMECQPSLAGSDLAGALGLVQANRDRSDGAAPVVVMSSLRRGSLDGLDGDSAAENRREQPTGDGGTIGSDGDRESVLFLEPSSGSIENVRIADIEVVRAPGGTAEAGVRVRLQREGSLAASASRLTVSGPALAVPVERLVDWEVGSAEREIEVPVTLPSLMDGGPRNLELVAAVDPDGQTADDRRHATLDVRPRILVAVSADGGGRAGWMERALAPSRESPIETVRVEPGLLDARALRDVDALTLSRPDRVGNESWEAIGQLLDRGGLVVIEPPAGLESHAWLDRLAALGPLESNWNLRREVVRLDDDPERDPESIDPASIDPRWLPAVAGEAAELTAPVSILRRLDFATPPPAEEILLATSADDGAGRGAPLLVAASDPTSGGVLALLTTAIDLEWTDLPIRPLMVPLVQELLRSGLAQAESARRLAIGEYPTLRAPAVAVETPSGSIIESSGSGSVLERPISEVGAHRALDEAGRPIALLAANIDPGAASTIPTASAVAAERLGSLGAIEFVPRGAVIERLAGRGVDSDLSRLALLSVIGLALLELLLARRFSRSAREARRDSGEAPAFLETYTSIRMGRRS